MKIKDILPNINVECNRWAIVNDCLASRLVDSEEFVAALEWFKNQTIDEERFAELCSALLAHYTTKDGVVLDKLGCKILKHQLELSAWGNFLNVYDKTPLSKYHAQIVDNNFAAHRNIHITPSLSALIKDTLERACKSKRQEERPKLAIWLYGDAPMDFLPDFEMYAGPLYANAYRREPFDRERLEELISQLEKNNLLRRHYQRKIDSGILTSGEEQVAKDNIVKIDSTMIGGQIMRIRANF